MEMPKKNEADWLCRKTEQLNLKKNYDLSIAYQLRDKDDETMYDLLLLDSSLVIKKLIDNPVTFNCIKSVRIWSFSVRFFRRSDGVAPNTDAFYVVLTE